MRAELLLRLLYAALEGSCSCCFTQDWTPNPNPEHAQAHTHIGLLLPTIRLSGRFLLCDPNRKREQPLFLEKNS